MSIRRPFGLVLASLALVVAPFLVARTPLVRPLLERGPESEEHEAKEAPSDWFWAQRSDRDGTVPMAKFHAALANVRLQRTRPGFGAMATHALTWTNVGPFNIGGRVTALAVPLSNISTIYLGAANGGVWKSVNAGVNWTCVTDGLPFYSVGALAVDPSDAQTVYCGTGEANGSVDSYDGNGLWVTRDGGANWTSLGLANSGRIARVVVDPANPLHLLVAVMGHQFSTGPDRGLFRSLDGGATWDKVLFVSDSTGVTDLQINPAHPDTMYAATWTRVRRTTYRRASGPESGVWRSIDRGATWARLSVGLPTPTDSVGRIALAVAPSKPSTVYAQITTGYSLGYSGLGFYRSTDAGNTWSRRSTGGTWSSNFGGFAWYFGDIGVDPNNPDHVWTMGVSLYSSSNGGSTWSSVNGSLHADQHAIWIDPANSNHIYEGNDGGFYWSTTGTSWTHSTDLPISQFYDGDVSPANADAIYGGTQDNNTLRTLTGPSNWSAILGGDGFHVLVDPVTPQVVFFEYQYCCNNSGFVRSTNGGTSYASTSGWVSSDRFGWDTPIGMNPRNHNLLLAGSQYVYRSTNNGITWGKISGDLSTNPVSQLLYGCITTLAISNADTNTYYAGTDDGRVWRSTNRGGAWTDVSAGLPGRWVTRVVPDPADPQVVYVTESGFSRDEQAALVYRSDDRGATWTNISANLPNIPANDLVVDPTDTRTLIVGTDLGVWISRTGGDAWYPLGGGMPLQTVFDLTLHDATRQLFAFTHGRSAWKIDLTDLPPVSAPDAVPTRVALSAPWPNPARNAVRMSLELPRAGDAEVAIYDVLGRRVSTLFEGAMNAGRHEIAWDLRDQRGRRAAAGVYFARASAGGVVRTQRVVVVE